MKCPRCQHENRPTAKFCQECAAPLARVCTKCGTALPEKARFCPECAHPADEHTPSHDAPEANVTPAAGERRQATVVFADISGYTQLCTSVDAEQVQALLNRFYALMDGTVAAYGGKVIDHAGDGVLAVFGAPVAYGNDPERAVRAALEMQTTAAQLSDPSGNPLKLHIGIASGEVVAAVLSGGATPKYAVTGDTVNLAARLDALAQAGDTVLSQSVYDSVANLVDAEDLGEKTVKGFASAVRVYRVRSLQHDASERLPFVGRHSELRQLAGVLESVRETGAGGVVVIRGDPGIGKSRLTEELRWRALAQGFACHVGRVLDFGVGKGEEALPSVVATLLGLSGHEPEPIRRAALRTAIDTGLSSPEHEAFVSDLLDLEQRAELETIFDAMENTTRLHRTAQAVAGLAASAAAKRPQLIVFEDIHWGTPLLLACLAALAITTRERPLVLAMTTRFEGDPLDRQWRAASHGTPLLAIDVGPLLPSEARVLASGVIDTSNRFAVECVERAEGNPLFLEQLLRNARESQSGAIPPTIQSLVLARMDRLPSRDKLALQAASVIGKRFMLDALRFLLEDEHYRCDPLINTDLVRPESGGYLFAHALIQEGVYSSLLNSRKRELHARAAQWYREHEPALYAEHLERAQDPGAAQAYLTAAQEEARRFHYDGALRLAERGWRLVSEDRLRHGIAMLRGELLRQLARTEESIEAFEQALASAGGDEQRCQALLGTAAGYRITGNAARAMEALAHAQPIAERLELWSACSRIHSTRGNLNFALGRVAACRDEHQLALDYAVRAGDLECEALAWSGLGDHSYAAGRMHTALGHFRRCVELCRRAGLVRAEIPNLCMGGHCLSWTGQGEASLQDIRKAVDLSRRIGVPQIEVMTLESIAFALVMQGQYDEAEAWLSQALPLARQASAHRYVAVDLLLLAACRRARGRPAEALQLLDQALELCAGTGLMGFIGPGIFAGKASAAQDPGERRRWLRQGEQLLAAGCLAHARLLFYREAIDVVLVDGDQDGALRYVEELEEFVRPEPIAFATLVARRARALIELARSGPRPELVAELKSLRAEVIPAGWGSLAPGIDAALGAASRRGVTGAA